MSVTGVTRLVRGTVTTTPTYRTWGCHTARLSQAMESTSESRFSPRLLVRVPSRDGEEIRGWAG